MADADKEAIQRRERLKALRNKRSRHQEGKGSGENEQENVKPQLKFRSYNPQSEDFKEKKLPKAKPEDIEAQVSEQLETGKDMDLGDVNLTNLAPRKVDWDLKRELTNKMEKLERRTQRAIVELIRERLKGDQLSEEVADAITSLPEEQYDSD